MFTIIQTEWSTEACHSDHLHVLHLVGFRECLPAMWSLKGRNLGFILHGMSVLSKCLGKKGLSIRSTTTMMMLLEILMQGYLKNPCCYQFMPLMGMHQHPMNWWQLKVLKWGCSLVWSEPASQLIPLLFHCSPNQPTVIFSHNNSTGTVNFSQVSDQRTGPIYPHSPGLQGCCKNAVILILFMVVVGLSLKLFMCHNCCFN